MDFGMLNSKNNFFKGQIDYNFITFISAFVVFLSILSIAIIVGINSMFSKWDEGLSKNIIVQVLPYVIENGQARIKKDDLKSRMVRAVNIIENIKGVKNVSVVEDKVVKENMKKLLGKDADFAVKNLPLPYIIEVKISDYIDVNNDDIKRALKKQIKGFSVYDNKEWAGSFISFTKVVKRVSWFVFYILIACSVLIIFYFTQSFLKVQKNIIRVAHIVGAYDRYIATAFASRILLLSIIGSFIGFIVAFATIFSLSYFLTGLKEVLVVNYSLSVLNWLVLIALPFLVVFIFYKTAEITVLRYLKKTG